MAEITPQPLLWPGEADLRNMIVEWVKQYGNADKNLGNLTSLEGRSLSELEKYLSGDFSPEMKAGSQEILSTLQGGYNPESSAYYAPLMKGIEQRRGESRDRLRRQSQLGGNLSSLARARLEAESDTSYDAQIAELMMGLQERERQRRLDVLTPAAQYGQYVEESPLRKAEAARAGDIPRQLETRAMDLGYNTLTGYNPTYYYPLYTADSSRGGNRWGSAASGALGGAATGSAFGPWGAAGGAILGGLTGYFG